MDSTQKANKAAKNAERMEAQFTMNEESINDLVQRAVQQAVSKLRPVSLPVKTPQAPRKTPRSRKNERSSSENRSKRRDLSGMVTSVNCRHQKTPHKADEVAQYKDDSQHLESLVLAFLIAGLLPLRVASSQKT